MKILETTQRREIIYHVRIDREDIIAWLRELDGGIPANANIWIGYDYKEAPDDEYDSMELDVVISQ